MAGVFGNGTILTVGSAIAELTSITGPGVSADTIDITTHDSADGYREYVAGLKNAGEVSVEGNVTTATAANTFLALLTSGAETTGATIVYPTTPAATMTFDCLVTAFEIKSPHDDKISFTATMKVTGKPVLS